MNVKEKLVELLKKADKEALSAAEMGKPYNETEVMGRMADYLIAHGVTVRKSSCPYCCDNGEGHGRLKHS